MAKTTIERRVARLEEAAGGGGECPECGWGGGDDFGPNDTHELTFIDPGGPDDREEFCEACGWQLVYVIGWGEEA